MNSVDFGRPRGITGPLSWGVESHSLRLSVPIYLPELSKECKRTRTTLTVGRSGTDVSGVFRRRPLGVIVYSGVPMGTRSRDTWLTISEIVDLVSSRSAPPPRQNTHVDKTISNRRSPSLLLSKVPTTQPAPSYVYELPPYVWDLPNTSCVSKFVTFRPGGSKTTVSSYTKIVIK